MQVQIHKIMRYLFTGGVGAGVNFIIYFILLRFLGLWYILASIISFLLSLLVGFYLQKHFTFRNFSVDNTKKQMLLYYLFSFLNLIINIILLYFFVEIVKVDQVFAKVLTLGILAIWSYFVYQKYIFK